MEESLSTMVPIDSGMDEPQDIEIGEIIPIKQWAEGYNAVKFRGHIFCPSNQTFQRSAIPALKVFLQQDGNDIKLAPMMSHQ